MINLTEIVDYTNQNFGHYPISKDFILFQQMIIIWFAIKCLYYFNIPLNLDLFTVLFP